ncbi:hypothetical protein MNBD_GAMMA12-3914 [hydrothermal vent metagenome]|uniref:Uncharacterized protein n=1 Tax=hydrothermal vent metagenome TaxID=652676 RepID=A0A3B0Y4B9_9ZZZZ
MTDHGGHLKPVGNSNNRVMKIKPFTRDFYTVLLKLLG